LDKSSADHIKSIPKQDNSYRNIIMITAIRQLLKLILGLSV
jgi:hypothetical protein